MDMQKEREVFEKSMRDTFKGLVDLSICRNSIDPENPTYMKWDAQVAWHMWQAAKASAVPDGYVLVPKEPTEHIIEAGWLMQSMYDSYKAMIEAAQEQNQ